MSEADLLSFRSIIARRMGLFFDDHRREFLVEILNDRAAAHRTDVGVYLKHLDEGDWLVEWHALGMLLTVTETYFLRGTDHFVALLETVLPDRLRQISPARPLRLLSAGCSSGEEPYSLAISLCENPHLLAGRPVEIIGVDINRTALAKARAGRYSSWSLRDTPPRLREKYFKLVGSEFVLDESIRDMVAFHERNFAASNHDLWLPGRFDVVFCRNMLMYFVPETAAAIVERIQYSLAPGGCLFLGHAETLRGLSQAFHLRRAHGSFYYQLRGADEEHLPELPLVERMAEPSPLLSAGPGNGAALPWYEEIGRASARIASLSTAKPATVSPAPVASTPAFRNHRISRVLDLHQQERFTEALAHLEGMPGDTASDPDLQVLQAMLLVNCGRIAEAEALCQPLLGRHELNAGVRYVTALCREQAGDLPASEEHDAAAAYLDPSFAMPRFHLGLVCKRLGRTADAHMHFEAALALLVKEDAVRLLLFGGGFSRETLVQACRSELQRLNFAPC